MLEKKNNLMTIALPPLQSIYPKPEASTMPVCVGFQQTPIYKKRRRKKKTTLLDKKCEQFNSQVSMKLTSTCKDGR